MRDSKDKTNERAVKGFTLIELMVVLGIITIIATASIPQVQMWTGRNRGKAAVSNIISDFAKARAMGSYAMKTDDGAAVGADTRLERQITGLLFRKTSYVILQKDPTTTVDWNENTSGFQVLRKAALPMNVSIELLNTGATNDGGGTSPTLEFTSSGKVKQSNGLLVPPGAGAGNLFCNTASSPLDGRRVLVAILKASVNDDKAMWYQLEIDSTGEYFVCVEPGDNGTAAPDFQGVNANILEM